MIQLNNVSFLYGGDGRETGVKHISLHIRKGEVVLLCGESGCGKTTLTRLVNGLIPRFYEGSLSGEVRLNGQMINEWPLYETAKYVGSVFQNPRSQFFNLDVTSEVIFACENQALPEDQILQRLHQAISDFQLTDLKDRSLFALSGGEKQKVACASVGASDPQIIVLDEPSSNLDTKTTGELAAIIARWKADGKTILIAEHRLYYLRHLADRIIYMQHGEVCKEYTPDELEALGPEALQQMGLRPMQMDRLALSSASPAALGRALFLKNFTHTYPGTNAALNIPDLSVPSGSIIALVGHNGAGKTTFARLLTGLQKKCQGLLCRDAQILVAKTRLSHVYMVMQDVNHQLFTESVLDEVLLSMEVPDTGEAERILDSLDLWHLKDSHPMSLSGGQKQRVAIAGAIASNRDIILFDEPTSGLDFRHMQQVAALLKQLQDAGKTIFVISHDPELILSCCNHVIQIEHGRLMQTYPLTKQTKHQLLSFFFPPDTPDAQSNHAAPPAFEVLQNSPSK